MIKCPNCGASHYNEGLTLSTALYWQPEYKDGVLQNSNPNTSTTEYLCLDCNHKFRIKVQHDKIISNMDLGEIKPTQTSDIAINNTDYVPIDTKVAMATIDTSTNTLVRHKYQWEVDIEELREQLKQVMLELQEIKGKL